MNHVALRKMNKSYQNDALEAAVFGASPVGLIVLLYDGAISALEKAKQCIEQNNLPEKARFLSKAFDIVEGLDTCLDMDKGKDISSNLHDLYLYMKKRVGDANVNNDTQALDEVLDLLAGLSGSWKELDRMLIAQSKGMR